MEDEDRRAKDRVCVRAGTRLCVGWEDCVSAVNCELSFRLLAFGKYSMGIQRNALFKTFPEKSGVPKTLSPEDSRVPKNLSPEDSRVPKNLRVQ